MSAETPTKAEKERLIETLREKRNIIRANKLRDFRPYAVQQDVIAATFDHSEVGFRAGNQQGKTMLMSAIASPFTLGQYPDGWPGRVFDRPTRGWIVGESSQSVRDVAQRYLLGNDV